MAMENYEEHFRDVADWRVQIVAYALNGKHVCIINNTDPQATLCRVTAPSRVGALDLALREARVRLEQTPVTTVAPRSTIDESLTLSRLEYRDDGAARTYQVSDFMGLPVTDRMRMVLSGRLAFIGSDGSNVPPDVAMRLLGKASAA